MNIRELIDELLSHSMEPTTEVRIEVSGAKSVATYRVTTGRSGGCKVLTIEPDEDLITTEDAQDAFMSSAEDTEEVNAARIYLREQARLLKQLAERDKIIALAREVLELSAGTISALETEADGDTETLPVIMKALAAIDDSKLVEGLVLCDAEPRSHLYKHKAICGDGYFWSHRCWHNGTEALESLPLYTRRTEK